MTGPLDLALDKLRRYQGGIALSAEEARAVIDKIDGMPKPNLDDWSQALEVAYTWGGYWEDDPIVHVDTGQVGFLARSFAYAMAYFGVIQKPEQAS